MVKKISICFYGITRNLKKTFPNIEKNIIIPASKFGEVSIFCHFFENNIVDNIRSKEFNIKIEKNWDLFNASKLISDPPDLFLEQYDTSTIYKFNDPYNDEFKSIRNLLHQLYSLKKVFHISKIFKSDITLFIRPDLLYLNSIEKIISDSLMNKKDTIYIPSWQSYRGLNDRFSICNSYYSAKIYSERIDRIRDFLNDYRLCIKGESLLYYAILNSRSKIKLINNKAKRVRANGVIVNENFEFPNHLIRIKHYLINDSNKSKIIFSIGNFIIYLDLFYFEYKNSSFFKKYKRKISKIPKFIIKNISILLNKLI